MQEKRGFGISITPQFINMLIPEFLANILFWE